MSRNPVGPGRAAKILWALAALGSMAIVWRAAGSPILAGDAFWLDLAINGRPSGQGTGTAAHLLLLEALSAFIGERPFLTARAASVLLYTLGLVPLGLAVAAFEPAGRARAVFTAGLLLLAQTYFFAGVGGIPPQLSAMAWVGAGLLLVLRRVVVPGAAAPGSSGACLAIGAVTALAVRAHPSGAILLWPALLLLRENGYWLTRQGARRLALCLLGAGLALALVGGLFAATSGRAVDAATPAPVAPPAGEWPRVVWPGPVDWPGSGGPRALALLVLGAAIAAAATGQSFARRWLHLTPLVFVAGLLGHGLFSNRAPAPVDLLAVLPVACVLGARFFSIAGLGALSARDLLAPRFLLPFLALAAVVAVIDPYLAGRLDPSSVLPAASPVAAADLARRTLAPGAAVLLLVLAAFGLRRRSLRLPILLSAAILAMGPSVLETTRLLATRLPARQAEATLAPWRALGDRIELREGLAIGLSPGALADSSRFGPPAARETIARLALGEPTLRIGTDRRSLRRADYLLVAADETWDSNRFELVPDSPEPGESSSELLLLRTARKKRGAGAERSPRDGAGSGR